MNVLSITVIIPYPMRHHAEGRERVLVIGNTVREVLDDLEHRLSDLYGNVCDENGEILPFINVFVNNDDIRQLGGLAARVSDGDTIFLVPPLAGGVRSEGTDTHEQGMFIIDDRNRQTIYAQAEAGYPAEVCGLLIGVDQDGESARLVCDVKPSRNVNESATSLGYRIAAADYVSIARDALSSDLEIVGVYHSHPDHPAIPSETDRRLAVETWGSARSWSYAILEVTRGKTISLRSWILEGGKFQEESIAVVNRISDHLDL